MICPVIWLQYNALNLYFIHAKGQLLKESFLRLAAPLLFNKRTECEPSQFGGSREHIAAASKGTPTVFVWVLNVYGPMGPSIKYVTLQGEGSEKVWQFVTGGGERSCDVTLVSFLTIHNLMFLFHILS